MHSKIVYAVMGLFAVLVLAGAWLYGTAGDKIINFNDTEAVPEYQLKDRETPLKIAMISVLSHEDTAKYQNQLADSIGRKLNRPVMVMRRRSYAEINQLLNKGDADIGLLSTGAYCLYGKKEGLALLAMQERNHLSYYYSYIIVPADSDSHTLEALRGKKFAYVDPLSYSGFLAVQERLGQAGESAESYFGSYFFTYSHDASIRSVINGFADGASIDSLAYDYLTRFQPELAQKIRVIETMPPRGTGPMVARKNLPEAEQIQAVLLHIHEDSIARDALEHLLIDKFILPDPSLYPDIDWHEKEAG